MGYDYSFDQDYEFSPSGTFYILDESGNVITDEDGNPVVSEDAP